MLRFIRSRITNSAEIKNEDLTDYFRYSKLTTHGFPQKASCLAIDEQLELLAIGTKDARIIIVGDEGINWSTTIEPIIPIAYIYFAIGCKVLIVLCDDPETNIQNFFRCQILDDRLELTRFNQETHLKRITCCEMLNREDGNSALLIGTIIGNIYALWIQNLELIEYLVFLDTSLKNIKQLMGEKKSIDRLSINPEDPEKMFLLFNNKIVVLYDTLNDKVQRIFTHEILITNIHFSFYSSKLFCSLLNGSYLSFEISSENSDCEPLITKPFGAIASTFSINKIRATKIINNNNDNLVIFSDGMPKALYGDRFTVTLKSPKKLLVLDFESRVIDFNILNNKNGFGIALFILCEQELVAVDLRNSSWKFFQLPHFNPIIYSSPITTYNLVSNLSDRAYAKLCQIHDDEENNNLNTNYFSKRKWPLRFGKNVLRNRLKYLNAKDVSLLLTGHENGCVNIWQTNFYCLKHLISCNTAKDFEGYFDNEKLFEDTLKRINSISSSSSEIINKINLEETDNEESLPFRKAGLFDLFCDDYRLSITKIVFDNDTGQLLIGGQSGQILLYELNETSKSLDPAYELVLNMAEDHSTTTQLASFTTTNKTIRNISKNLAPRKNSRVFPPGFFLAFNTIIQFKPVNAISAIAKSPTKPEIVVGGNEFGYAICCLASRQILAHNCLISTNDISVIANLNGTLSRFKSVKKSIRQSFRRKKRRENNFPISSPNETIITSKRNQRLNYKNQNSEEFIANRIAECRPIEREITQRISNPNVLNGATPHSLVKIIKIFTCRLNNTCFNYPQDCLFVGTYSGSVFIHYLSPIPNNQLNGGDSNNSNINEITNVNFEKCPLIKEIRFRHRAPVVNIELVQDLLSSRLLIFTEEQIRAFFLPGLKPSKYKCRFTALEGSQIKKSFITILKSQRSENSRNMEKFITIITNRGEVYLISLINSRKNIKAAFTRTTDITGISLASINVDGDLFVLKASGSELQRSSISAASSFLHDSNLVPFKNEQMVLI